MGNWKVTKPNLRKMMVYQMGGKQKDSINLVLDYRKDIDIYDNKSQTKKGQYINIFV